MVERKIKKPFVIIGIFAIVISVGLSGCTEGNTTQSPEKNKFVGTWYKSNTAVMDLHADGTCSYAGQSGTWTVKDDTLLLVLSSGYNPSFHYTFSDSDLILKLTSTLDGSTAVYTKRGP